MVFETKEKEVLDFSTMCRVDVPVAVSYTIVLGGESTKRVKEFRYLGKVLCRHGDIDEEIRHEWQECHRVHKGILLSNLTWFKDVDMEWSTIV